MMKLIGLIVILSVVFWVVCETISAFVGLIFIMALMALVFKLFTEMFK